MASKAPCNTHTARRRIQPCSETPNGMRLRLNGPRFSMPLTTYQMTVSHLVYYGMNDRSRVAANYVWFEHGGAPALASRAGWGVIKPMVGPAREPTKESSIPPERFQ